MADARRKGTAASQTSAWKACETSDTRYLMFVPQIIHNAMAWINMPQ
jgi:hypothetical protein